MNPRAFAHIPFLDSVVLIKPDYLMSITWVPNMLKYKVKSPFVLERQLRCCAAANIYKDNVKESKG